MRKILLIPLLLSTVAALAPATAQNYADQRRWEAAQARYQSETQLYRQERARYIAAQARDHGDAYRDDDRGPGYDENRAPPPNGAYGGNGPPPNGAYRDQDDDDQGPPPPPPGTPYAGPNGGSYDRYRTDYDAARDYRDEPGYQERRLGRDDMVYRGSDGRYYCRRSDGTTGLVIGAVGGGVLGNIIDGGRNRVAGTLIGGALGALAGQAIDRNSDVRCR